MTLERRRRGQRNYHAGCAAEDSVARDYAGRGALLRETRWRGQGGEVDLIVEDGEDVVFVEVKRARDFATAAQALGERQIRRICDAAAEYVGRLPRGLLTPMRFDLALVDAQGRVSVIPNAFGDPGW